MQADDAELVTRFRAGDQSAFNWLVVRYTKYCGAVALGVLGDEHEAADVVQESFLKAYKKIGGLKDASRFKSWLRLIVRSTAIDRTRARKNFQAFHNDDGETVVEPVASGHEPVGQLQHSERATQIRKLVEALPREQREVVVLKYLQGLSYEEIAEATQSTVSSVESRLHRARQKLKISLKAFIEP